MRTAAVVLSVLVSAGAASSQTAPVVLGAPLSNAGCPVSMTVQRNPASSLLPAGVASAPTGAGNLHIELSSRISPITGADLTF